MMNQRDYILRLIESLTEGIAFMLGLKKEKKEEQALEYLNELMIQSIQLNSKMVNSLSERDLLGMLSINGVLRMDSVAGIALLLKEEGDIYEQLGQHETAGKRLQRALSLMLEVMIREPDLQFINIRDETEQLIERLGPSLPTKIERKRFSYYEVIGRYDLAENVLFHQLRLSAKSDWLQAGKALYERLLRLKDEQLVEGGLPRDEVLQSYSELTNM
ncbi:DUF6483 family protein [Paenibacillus sp. IHBB 10380]|uniref:DUF6483 family protein n=1 Tax=Paenibacillus sp. IHBB 10380 TaxID=1566358 RepID=UPI0005CF96A6|nr:DUF6483 family protein [Paenibacillus sp. IHBB 10380]AJS58365.1 hypothetical protein UB51_07475 [Paenibacillus sp. IHBB 10380]